MITSHQKAPSEPALKAARDIYWGTEWPGGSDNYPDDLNEIIDWAHIIDARFAEERIRIQAYMEESYRDV